MVVVNSERRSLKQLGQKYIAAKFYVFFIQIILNREIYFLIIKNIRLNKAISFEKNGDCKKKIKASS